MVTVFRSQNTFKLPCISSRRNSSIIFITQKYFFFCFVSKPLVFFFIISSVFLFVSFSPFFMAPSLFCLYPSPFFLVDLPVFVSVHRWLFLPFFLSLSVCSPFFKWKSKSCYYFSSWLQLKWIHTLMVSFPFYFPPFLCVTSFFFSYLGLFLIVIYG